MKLLRSFIKISLVLCIWTLVIACEEESKTVLSTVCYQIDLPDTIHDFSANVEYFSDLYYASGDLKTVEIDSSNIQQGDEYWLAKRYLSANEERDESYYIKVKVAGLPDSIDHLKVRVLFNDSILIDEKGFDSGNTSVEISGSVPDKF